MQISSPKNSERPRPITPLERRSRDEFNGRLSSESTELPRQTLSDTVLVVLHSMKAAASARAKV
jgi:hypothetical protein